MRIPVVRAFLSWLLLLAATLAPAAPSALAAPAEQAAGGAGVHFQGTFDLGSTPAAAGTSITVIVARSVDDVTTCGTGSVSGANGQFRVDTQADPPCVNSATSRNNGPFIFVANGENVGGCACMPTLESPTSLGHALRIDLRGFLAPPAPGSAPLRGGVSNTPDQAPPRRAGDTRESLGVGAAAVCAVPLLLVTVACPPAGEMPRQQQPQPQPQPAQPPQEQPQPQPQPLPVPLPVQVQPQPRPRCQYQGGQLVYTPERIDHIMTGHARGAAIRPVPPRTGPQGIFFSDVWYTDPPTATVRPVGVTSEVTDCVFIVIRDEPSPASIITALPIAC